MTGPSLGQPDVFQVENNQLERIGTKSEISRLHFFYDEKCFDQLDESRLKLVGSVFFLWREMFWPEVKSYQNGKYRKLEFSEEYILEETGQT